MKCSDLFIKALENEGVEYIFGVPGEENLDFLESLRTSSIKLVLTRHEQGAGFMAATYGRLTGHTGVCLATLGPGATNFVTASCYAQLGAMPMMMITGQKPVKKSKQGRFQIVETVPMFTPITKFAKQIVNANTVPSLVREAFRLAEEERPGAVNLELPEDIAHEYADQTQVYTRRVPRRPHADEKAIEQAIKMIRAAKRPLLLVGAGANRKRIMTALREFVDHTGIPFFNTQMGKGVLSERHDLFIGTAALSDTDYVHCAIDRADLIINAGHDVVEKPPFFMEHGGMKVIHINFKEAEVDAVYFPQLEVIGDIADSFQEITKDLEPNPEWDFDYFMRVAEQVHKSMDAGEDNPDYPLKPQRVVADVRRAMPDDGIIALDNGMYKIWFARNYRAYQANTILLDNALATMGAGLPSAMMAAMLYPERKVMAIAGDGGFMMNSQEIETAVRYKLNLVVLILRDDAYGLIKWKQTGGGFPSWGLDYGNPDFVKYAEAYGARGHRVESTEGFLPLLQECLDEEGVDLIDCPVDYSENVKVLIEELSQKVCLL
ncbi:MAG: acetolactate synthase large subunit [Xanthomonadales bacterium]|nr:acetolactate synthase large subunit [Xanthomonadales bacterium]